MAERTSATLAVKKRLFAVECGGGALAGAFAIVWIPAFPPFLQLVVSLCLYDGFLTYVDLNFSALLVDLAPSAERADLNSAGSLFSIGATLSVVVAHSMWSKESPRAFRALCMVLALISAAGFTVASRVLRPYAVGKDAVVPVAHPPSRPAKTSVFGFAKQVLSHRNMLWFMAMQLVQVFNCHFNSNFFPLFLENLVGDSLLPSHASLLLGLSFVAPHLNNVLFSRLCKIYGTYNVIQVMFFTKCALAAVTWYFGRASIVFVVIFIASNRIFSEGICKLLGLVVADLVDEDRIIHQRPSSVAALVFGATNFTSKPGQTLAPLFGTWLLSTSPFAGKQVFHDEGDVSSSSGDDDAMADGLFRLLCFVPLMCGIMQLYCWSKFKLRGRRLLDIKQKVAALEEGDELAEKV